MSEYTIDVIREKYALVPRTLIFIRSGEKYLLIHKKKIVGFVILSGIFVTAGFTGFSPELSQNAKSDSKKRT